MHLCELFLEQLETELTSNSAESKTYYNRKKAETFNISNLVKRTIVCR